MRTSRFPGPGETQPTHAASGREYPTSIENIIEKPTTGTARISMIQKQSAELADVIAVARMTAVVRVSMSGHRFCGRDVGHIVRPRGRSLTRRRMPEATVVVVVIAHQRPPGIANSPQAHVFSAREPFDSLSKTIPWGVYSQWSRGCQHPGFTWRKTHHRVRVGSGKPGRRYPRVPHATRAGLSAPCDDLQPIEHIFDTGAMRDDSPRWHPQLLARETSPAHWVMLDAHDKVAGTIELRRTDDGPRYRVEVAGGEVLGWATSLRTATERLHRVIISAGVPVAGSTVRDRQRGVGAALGADVVAHVAATALP